MWCSSCRADVAAELSTDNRRMLCTRCQSELGVAASATPLTSTTPRTVETERDARELLARWSTQNLLDQPGSVGSIPKPGIGQGIKVEKTHLRIDPPRLTNPPSPSVAFKESAAESLANPVVRQENQDSPSTKQAPPVQNSKPSEPAASIHSTNPVTQTERDSISEQDRIVREALQKQLNRRFGLSTFGGQLFAYGGVATLTCGTVLITWSYFGGPPSYLPTGLLTAAVGQMLLFLGVVTLISSGMEQTVHEVSWRIDHLAEEIYHLGLALDDLESNGARPKDSAGPSSDQNFMHRAA